MRQPTSGIGWQAARWAPMAAMVILAMGCDPGTSPTAPKEMPSPAPKASPVPRPFPDAVFLAAPAPPTRSSTTPLVGRYQLEIDAGARSGASCASVPGYAIRRQYTADVESLGGHYAVKLFDAAFLSDSSRVSYGCLDSRLPQSGRAVCHQFILAGDADALTVTAQSEDEWRGSEIWEGLPDGFLLEITGRATGMMRDGRIEATGTGVIWYGNGLPANTFHACHSAELRFTFSPR